MQRYILLDAASMKGAMDTVRELNPLHTSLYCNRNGQDEIHPSVAPFLFKYDDSIKFVKYVINNGWGKSWGIWVDSNAEFEELCKHFRRFLVVQTEGGPYVYFRFYDPRVLRVLLPTCSHEQLNELFGPVNQFIMEDEDPAFYVLFSLWQGELFVDRQDASLLGHILKD